MHEHSNICPKLLLTPVVLFVFLGGHTLSSLHPSPPLLFHFWHIHSFSHSLASHSLNMPKPLQHLPINSSTQFFRHTHSFSHYLIPHPIHPHIPTHTSQTLQYDSISRVAINLMLKLRVWTYTARAETNLDGLTYHVDDSLVGEDSKYFAVGLAFLMPSHHLPDGNNYYPFNIFA